MTKPSSEYLAAQLAELAQTTSGFPELKRSVLNHLQPMFGCDTVLWGEYPGAVPTEDADGVYSAPTEVRGALNHFLRDRGRYDLPHAKRLLRAAGGIAVDDEVLTAVERDRLPLYAEILRPAGIRTFLAISVEFRGRAQSLITLSRHARGARFLEREKHLARSIKNALGLVEAAFRSATDPVDRSLSERCRDAFQLTARESQVARMVARGLQNKEIAELLGTAPDTVRKQTIRIYQKLGVRGRVQLARALTLPLEDSPLTPRGDLRAADGRP
jgi:DNA-binding CsgD family transcriptional regulator